MSEKIFTVNVKEWLDNPPNSGGKSEMFAEMAKTMFEAQKRGQRTVEFHISSGSERRI